MRFLLWILALLSAIIGVGGGGAALGYAGYLYYYIQSKQDVTALLVGGGIIMLLFIFISAGIIESLWQQYRDRKEYEWELERVAHGVGGDNNVDDEEE